MAKVKQLLSLHHLFPRTHRLFPKTHRFFPKIADRTQTPFLFSLSPGHKHKPLFAYHKQAEKEDGNQERRSFSAISRIADHKDPDCRPPFTMAIGSTRFFSEDVTHFPDIKDPEILFVFKDLMAASWDELPDTLISDANKALSKNTNDKAAQEAVANVFRAAEAVGEFSGMLVSLRMAIDDSTGMGGEDVKPLPEEFVNALRTIYQRYTAYLDAFGPDETYLRKKVETELGTKMIHLKMRCSGIGSEWGKVTVLGTSGLSGSYVEHRA